MFYALAKIVWLLANPLHLALILLILSVLLMWTRWRRPGVWLASLVTIALLALAVLPLGHWALEPLAGRFSYFDPGSKPAAEPVDGIILLLGAAINLKISRQVGHAVPGHAAGRLVEFLRLAKAYPGARLLITGGNVAGDGRGPSEAALIADYLISRGISAARLMIDERSRDTYDNAVMGRQLARPRDGARWLLVTSTWHMPRAMGVFRAQGWPVVAAPPFRPEARDTAFQLRFNLRRGLNSLGVALHEYLGLAAYRAKGRTATLWPGP